jgi:formylglycine-generating enzyme required for sulfatase activity
MNTENSNRGGTRINEATGTTYTMKPYETMIVRTVYYYAEITNTIDGKTGITERNPCRVTFVDINDLQEKSRTMVEIPAGTVSNSISDWNSDLEKPWSTPGFSMGKYLVTYELWKFVADYADAGGYRFANSGTQGWWWDNYYKPAPDGNELNPAANVNFRDMVVWCNAYSEMDGRQPVYRDSDGNVLRDSRVVVEELIDHLQMTGKNGYRLPTHEEWLYAMKGANPGTSAPWTDQWPGTDDQNELDQYIWQIAGDESKEVGRLLPNSLGLYDMVGMGSTVLLSRYAWGDAYGFAYLHPLSNSITLALYFFDIAAIFDVYYHEFYLLRLVLNKEQ